MKDTKDISLLLIPYLTFCAALYHIAFWDTFNLNGLAFISLSDIIKSAIYPILSVILTILFQISVQHFVRADDKKEKPKRNISNLTVILVFLGALVLEAVLVRLTNTMQDPYHWVWTGIIYSTFPSVLIANNGFLANQFTSNNSRRFVIDLIVFLPVFSYCAGKFQSKTIQQNLKYKYTITANNSATRSLTTSSDTLKLLGNAEKHFIFSDLKNSKIFFIKSDIIDTLTLYDKK